MWQMLPKFNEVPEQRKPVKSSILKILTVDINLLNLYLSCPAWDLWCTGWFDLVFLRIVSWGCLAVEGFLHSGLRMAWCCYAAPVCMSVSKRKYCTLLYKCMKTHRASTIIWKFPSQMKRTYHCPHHRIYYD